jgi:hypothetical protein
VTSQIRQTRVHRGYKIVVVQLGESWSATIYALKGGEIVTGGIEGAAAQEAVIKAVQAAADWTKEEVEVVIRPGDTPGWPAARRGLHASWRPLNFFSSSSLVMTQSCTP